MHLPRCMVQGGVRSTGGHQQATPAPESPPPIQDMPELRGTSFDAEDEGDEDWRDAWLKGSMAIWNNATLTDLTLANDTICDEGAIVIAEA